MGDVWIMRRGGGNGGDGDMTPWNFNLATSVPGTVEDNTVVAVVANASVTKTISDTAPASPAAGAVWFRVAVTSNIAHIQVRAVLLHEGRLNDYLGAYQYTSGAWVLLPSYLPYFGVWKKFDALPAPGVTLNECSWEQIDMIGQAGKAPDYFALGDTKQLTVANYPPNVTMRIIGFGHDNLADGSGKAKMTFEMAGLLEGLTMGMNPTATNAGGWASSNMRAFLVSNVYNLFSQEVRNAIKTVTKPNGAAFGGSTNDNVFLLSQMEVSGTEGNETGTGTQYAYYQAGNSRIKDSKLWWLRTTANPSYFCVITNTGTIGSEVPNVLRYVSFAFCV